MKDTKAVMQDYVSDMIGLEKHIDGAVDKQADDDSFKNYADALDLIHRISRTLKSHQEIMQRELEALGGGGAKDALKKAATSVMGAAAGVISQVRAGDPVSRGLRDNYTSLNMAAISYTMLHTTALALKDRNLADLALRHLQDLTPLVMELADLIPSVVARELAAEDKAIDAAVGNEAARNTTQAWTRGIPSSH